MKFLRRVSKKFSKLGKGRKKKQVWRRPTGRDNKMRERKKSRPSRVEIGYKKNKENIETKIIYSLKELEKINKGEVVKIGRIGKKKKMEIAKKAKELKIEFQNMNVNQFLKKNKEIKNESK